MYHNGLCMVRIPSCVCTIHCVISSFYFFPKESRIDHLYLILSFFVSKIKNSSAEDSLVQNNVVDPKPWVELASNSMKYRTTDTKHNFDKIVLVTQRLLYFK